LQVSTSEENPHMTEQKIDWRELPIDSLFIVADPYIIIKRIKISQEPSGGMND
jgi:hypothetical protein